MRSFATLSVAAAIALSSAGAGVRAAVLTTPVPSNCSVTNAGITFAIVACPFCSAPSLTLTEQFSEADAVVLVKWLGGERSTQVDPGSTNYEILDIPRNKGVKLAKGKNIELPRYRAAKEGDLYVLMGRQGASFEWDTTLPVTKHSYEYMSNAPSPDLATVKRLEYYMKYLEDADELIAMDAYGEFANAPYEDITPLAKKLPREKLVEWVTDSKTSPTRLGLYGLLLGLCGTEADAKKMEEFITLPSQDYRLGLDGVVSGYLLLAGARGLDVIDRTKLKIPKPALKAKADPENPKTDNGDLLESKFQKAPEGTSKPPEQADSDEVPFSEVYAMVSAIRFMWAYDKAKTIPKARLKKSMRLLLRQPRVVDLVIPDLARWKDWEVAEELYSMYGKDEFDQRAIKLAIVKFLIHCSKDVPKPEGESDPKLPVGLPKHAKLAKELLEKIKATDPKTVRDAKRTMIF